MEGEPDWGVPPEGEKRGETGDVGVAVDVAVAEAETFEAGVISELFGLSAPSSSMKAAMFGRLLTTLFRNEGGIHMDPIFR